MLASDSALAETHWHSKRQTARRNPVQWLQTTRFNLLILQLIFDHRLFLDIRFPIISVREFLAQAHHRLSSFRPW